MPETELILRVILTSLVVFMMGYVFQLWMRKRYPPGFAAPADVRSPPLDAERHMRGLCSKIIVPGKGRRYPESTSSVTVHYTGWTTNGRMFDSSWMRGTPSTFKLEQLIEGWRQGLELMVVGEYRRLWIPQELAYQGKRTGPAGMLVFDVQLLAIDGVNDAAPEVAPDAAQDLAHEAVARPTSLASASEQAEPPRSDEER